MEESRLRALALKHRALAGGDPELVVRTPGRTELGGNHTDHQGGRVLAAAVDLDTLVVASRRNDGRCMFHSSELEETYDVELSHTEPRPEEQGTPTALLRGVVSILQRQGFQVGGFTACLASDVGIGSGLSSSASLEVSLGGVVSGLFNGGEIPVADLAKAGQEAEIRYFGKPCGLMDQMVCAHGGVLALDFRSPGEPEFRRVELDPEAEGYVLLLVDTGSHHSDLTSEYASIPREMQGVARALGVSRLVDVSRERFWSALPRLRREVGDRPVLRALHFLDENDRARRQVERLDAGDFPGFLQLARESGESSMKLLQNLHPACPPGGQPLTLGILLAQRFIQDEAAGDGVARVHGGGFAGAFQVYLREGALDRFRSAVEPIFGPGAVRRIRLRSSGIRIRKERP